MARTLTRLTLLALAITTLGSCSQIPGALLGGLGGSGTNVAANTQIGKENSQTFGVNTTMRPVLKPEGPVDTVVQDNSTTKITEMDPLLLLLLVLGWLAPSPNEIARGLRNLFRLNKKD
tara:strand:- start:836 stop:1192 length:357 start_codon:yes stop_codon:yes gene_type:complete